MSDPLLEQLLVGFVDEAQEIRENVTRSLLELEKADKLGGERFAELARGLHTLKGSSATLSLNELADLAHRMENVVLPLRDSPGPLPASIADGILHVLDVWMERLRATAAGAEKLPDLSGCIATLDALRDGEAPAKKGGGGRGPKSGSGSGKPGRGEKAEEKSGEEAPSTDAAEKAAPPGATPVEEPPSLNDVLPESTLGREEATWRVSTRRVLALLTDVERLREVRLRLEERHRALEKVLSQLARLGLLSETAESRALLMGVSRAVESDGDDAADIIASMEESLKAISTLPVRTVLEPLHRTVRDLCKHFGKDARLRITGGELYLDRRVLEPLQGVLSHMVRNALDHGIETPDERRARGKSREGALLIRVEQHGNTAFFELADDGAGLDLDRIRQVALRQALAPPGEIAAMNTSQLQQLIFRPGFTTRDQVSEVSGRGVGLDAVRNQVQSLQGTVEVQSTPGRGTRFIITLPAELGSSPVLVVRCGEYRLGIPAASVESARSARSADLRVGRTRIQIEHREQLLGVRDLGTLLGVRQPETPGDGQPLLIVGSQDRKVALAVDEVIGDIDLAIRPLPVELRHLPAYQGAATLAHGDLVLIVRTDWLLNIEKKGDAVLSGTRRALVVDDSLTARALHRTALESGGYAVHTASDGRQALEQLKHSAYDVMVCDIGMPEMDGFQLTSAVRARTDLDVMPVILVSARETEADRQRGMSAGADAFLLKRDCVAGRLVSEVAAVIARRKAQA